MSCADVLKGVKCAVVYGRAPKFGERDWSRAMPGVKIKMANRNFSPENLATHLEIVTSITELTRN